MRELARSLLGLLLLLALAELALRNDFAYEHLPLPRPYYTYEVTRSLHWLAQLQRERGPLDVLFVGSSAMRAAVDPVRFDARFEQRTHRPMLSFNGGMSRMYPSGVRLYLERVWLRHAHPRYVLHGVRAAELITHQLRPSYLEHGLIESLWLQPGPRPAIEAWLIERLRLLQYRGTLSTAIARLAAGSPLHVRERGEIVTDTRGHRPEFSSLSHKLRGHSSRLWKYHRAVSSKQWEPGFAELERMRQLCERAGVQYVLVNLPEHPARFSRPEGQALLAEYKRRLSQWAEDNDVPLLDITDPDPDVFAKDLYYSDYHHYNPAGARHFSTLLAYRFAKVIK